MLRLLILLFSFCFIEENIEAQKGIQADTLLLTLQDAETAFLKNNFDLLAAKYQIEEADAAVIQAKLWDNPNLNIEQGAYNRTTKKWFDISQNQVKLLLFCSNLFILPGKEIKE